MSHPRQAGSPSSKLNFTGYSADAALFAFQSPLSKGALLADEADLGKTIEAQRNEKRRSLFEAQDAIDRQRENLITLIEGKLLLEVRLEPLFHLAWRMN